MHDAKFVSIRLFLKYFKVKIKEEQKELAFKIYVTDIMSASIDWKTPPPRFADIINQEQVKKQEIKETRTKEERCQDILNEIGKGMKWG